MLSAALLLLSNSLFLTLHLSGNPGSFPRPLSRQEERECLEQWAQGDLSARNRLVEHNLRLVAHIIKKYYTQASNQEDLISIGTIGLIKAVNTFRPDKKIRLATYASRCIENEILMHFRAQRKLQGEVSLSEAIETDKAGNALYLQDVVGADDPGRRMSSAAATAWTATRPRPSARWLLPMASAAAMYRALKNAPWKSWRLPCGSTAIRKNKTGADIAARRCKKRGRQPSLFCGQSSCSA